MYTIFDIGTVAIFLEEGTGGRIIGLTLPAGEKFPEEFKVGDAVELTNHPSDPAQVAMGHITGFYEITETLVASKGSVRDRAESLGLVHVNLRTINPCSRVGRPPFHSQLCTGDVSLLCQNLFGIRGIRESSRLDAP